MIYNHDGLNGPEVKGLHLSRLEPCSSRHDRQALYSFSEKHGKSVSPQGVFSSARSKSLVRKLAASVVAFAHPAVGVMNHPVGTLSPLILLFSLLLMSGCIIFYVLGRRRANLSDFKEETDHDVAKPFDHLMQVAKEGFWSLNYESQKLAFFNPSMQKIWGITSEEFAANPGHLYDFIHPEDRLRVRQHLLDSIQEGHLESIRDEFRVVPKIGEIRWIRSEATGRKKENGNLAWIAGTMEDITDRIELEEQLKQNLVDMGESELRYRVLFQNAPVSLWEEDFSAVKVRLDTLRKEGIRDLRNYLSHHPEELKHLVEAVEVLSVNKSSLEMYHAGSEATLLGKLSKILGPESLPGYVEFLQSIWEGRESAAIETLNKTVDGETRKTIVRRCTVPGYAHNYGKIIVAITDVTQLEEYREKLQQARELFERFMDYYPGPAWVKDQDLRFVYSNKVYDSSVSGGESPVGKIDAQLWPLEIANKTRSSDLQVQRTLSPVRTHLTLPVSDGRTAHYAVTKFPIPDGKGHVSVGGIAFDITEQYETERALRESRQLYKELVESINEIVFSIDEKGFVTYLSPFSAESLWMTSDEIIGSHYSVLVHPEDLSMVNKTLIRVKQGYSITFECRFQLPDLTTRWGNVHVKPVFIDDHLAGVRGVVMEITKRKEAEIRAVELSEQLRALATRLRTAREEERIAISREIHDELGQKLTRLKIGLSLLKNDLSGGLTAKKYMKDVSELERSLDLIDGLMKDVKRISSELRPAELDQLGLVDAIKKSMDEYGKQLRMECRFISTNNHFVLNPDKSSALFRIFQEAMTNVMRHSEATEVEARLTHFGGKIILSVTDNGIGINESKIVNNKGLGVLGMKERALSIGGTFSLEPAKPSGTVVRVEMDM